MPTRIRWLDRRRHAVPDFDNGLVDNVSDRAMALIEAHEPGVHQFLPIDYSDVDGAPFGRRHALIVCNRIDSLDREHTTMVLHRGRVWQPATDLDPADRPPGCDISVPAKLVFSARQIGDTQLWWDRHLRNGPFLSDWLAGALKTSGLTGLRLHDSSDGDGVTAGRSVPQASSRTRAGTGIDSGRSSSS